MDLVTLLPLLAVVAGAALGLWRETPDLVTPLLFVALRLTIAAAVLLAIMARRSWAPLSGRRWLHCGIAGILLNGIGLMPPHVGMEMAPAAHIALVQSLTPILTALAGALWLSERLIPRQWAGLLLGVLGVGLDRKSTRLNSSH